MAKNKNQAIADKFFKENPEADQVHICDGFEFTKKNSAELHKITSGKKGLKVVSFDRKENTQEDQKEKSDKPVKLDRLKLDELRKLAESKGIRPEENATKAQIIEQIEVVENSKINE